MTIKKATEPYASATYVNEWGGADGIDERIRELTAKVRSDLAEEPYLMKPSRVEQILDIKASTRKRLMKEGELEFVKAGEEKQSTVRIKKSSVISTIVEWQVIGENQR